MVSTISLARSACDFTTHSFAFPWTRLANPLGPMCHGNEGALSLSCIREGMLDFTRPNTRTRSLSFREDGVSVPASKYAFNGSNQKPYVRRALQQRVAMHVVDREDSAVRKESPLGHARSAFRRTVEVDVMKSSRQYYPAPGFARHHFSPFLCCCLCICYATGLLEYGWLVAGEWPLPIR